MREIKFRAWDETNRRFEHFDLLGERNENLNTTDNILDWVRRWNWPVEQFTGLKDKNGREIYELDVIRHLKPNGRESIDVVTWDADWPGWNPFIQSKAQHFPYMITGAFVEVIGNIHENPELLNREMPEKKK